MKIKVKWTLKRLHKEALKHKNRQDFRNKSATAYQIAWRKRILDKICSHMTPSKSRPYSIEELSFEALKYTTRNEFAKKGRGAYGAALKNGVLDQICGHMEYVRTYWTDEMLQEEALKYQTRGDFSKYGASAYQPSYERGILDQICSHMETLQTDWTDEMLQEEALKYQTRGTFSQNSPSAYQIAWRKRILDKICSHMKATKGPSIAEKELFSIIKGFYPNAQKIRDTEVSIPDKAYIKGFEIDILVPELNKGIEFDGKYFHSFEKMRKDESKIKWSDDDIRNYHKIKDQWFAGKGIQILHIKEEDWKKNKKSCIKKCLAFLYNHNNINTL
jgi:hypothetical protein